MYILRVIVLLSLLGGFFLITLAAQNEPRTSPHVYAMAVWTELFLVFIWAAIEVVRIWAWLDRLPHPPKAPDPLAELEEKDVRKPGRQG